ncbi:MAG: replicative DNA helicase [Hyphomonadaceae bacterium]|jgi:replicative DNA helicase|nr:replicative DNA helicase [Hyphomonadaceae bacterium]
MISTARRATAETAERNSAPEGSPFRAAPHNLEAEQALLGAILVNNEAHDRVSSFLEPQHFYDPLHQQIYETAAKLIAAGKQATPITLKSYFETAEPIDATLSVPQYLGRLATNAATIINARDYGQTIYDLATRRQLILIGEDMVNAAYDSPVDFPPKEQIEEAETRLFSLAETGKYGQGFSTFSNALTAAIDMANNAYLRDGGLSGVATALKALDNKMGGLQPSDLIILAGRPSMGKTALVTNIAFNIARARARSLRDRPDLSPTDPAHDGAVVGFFSLEMSAEQLATRIMSEQAGIPSEKIRRGMIDEAEFKRLVEASQEMASLPLFIDQTGGISIAQLAARARKLKRQQGLGLIIVDYLQLLTGSTRRSSENRVQEVSQITTSMKALAKELNVPIIALSQLSRAVENREDKRPQLADLRESGSIEQDADVVMFVYREEYYVERTKPAEGTAEFQEWMAKMQLVSGKAEVIIGKQRHGPVGTVNLQFEASVTRFGDLANDAYIPARTD